MQRQWQPRYLYTAVLWAKLEEDFSFCIAKSIIDQTARMQVKFKSWWS